ncbi:MAG: DUF6390 family protein [Nocardioidaceae bacterium]
MTDFPAVRSSGADLFARYAYPPNELGYCGPADPGGLLVSGSPEAEREIARRARAFEGAWVYLEMIAQANGITDPLDPRVVEAYWLGNDLLTSVESGWFLARLRARFRGQSGGQWTGGIPDIDAGVVPHHAFHVFGIYPWVGLLGRQGDVARSVLDSCRIRTAVVTAVEGPRATVDAARLEWDGSRLGVGSTTEPLSVRWSHEGKSLLYGVEVGDLVAVHWDWVCDILSADQAAAAEHYERRQLGITNHLLAAAPGPLDAGG